MSRVRLGDVAVERKESNKAASTSDLPVVALEHLDPEQILLTRWEDNAETTFTKVFREGDILFGRRRAYQKKAAVAPFDGICSGDITVISADPETILPELLPFVIQNDIFFDYAVGHSAGSLSPRVKWEHLQNFEFNLPALDRQKTLADTLWAMVETKQAYLDLLRKTDDLVKSQFIEMFGDPISNSKAWKKEPLMVNASLINGRAYKQEELLESGKYPVLRVGNFFSNRDWYYSNLELEEDKYCDNGDLLYAWSASFGPRIWDGGKVIYHYHIWKVLIDNAYNKQFLCKLLDYVTETLMKDTHGIAMMHLTKVGMEQTEFVVPPIKLQDKFATFVAQADKSKFALQQTLDALNKTYKKIIAENLG